MQISQKDQDGLSLQAPYVEGPNKIGYLTQWKVSNIKSKKPLVRCHIVVIYVSALAANLMGEAM